MKMQSRSEIDFISFFEVGGPLLSATKNLFFYGNRTVPGQDLITQLFQESGIKERHQYSFAKLADPLSVSSLRRANNHII